MQAAASAGAAIAARVVAGSSSLSLLSLQAAEGPAGVARVGSPLWDRWQLSRAAGAAASIGSGISRSEQERQQEWWRAAAAFLSFPLGLVAEVGAGVAE